MNRPTTQPVAVHCGAVILLVSLLIAPTMGHAAMPFAKPSSALVAKEQAAARSMVKMAKLQRQAQASIAAANAVSDAARASQTQFDDYQASNRRLRENLRQANACLPDLRSRVVATDKAVVEVHQTLALSHAALQTIAQASDTVLASSARAADTAFAQRGAAEQKLANEHAALQKVALRCNNLTRSAQWNQQNNDALAHALADQARRLLKLRQTAQSQWETTLTAFQAANQAGWLKTPLPAEAPAGDQHVANLARELASSTRFASSAPQSSRSFALTPAINRLTDLWTQLARVQDATAYIDTQLAAGDCTPAACAAFKTERLDLTQRIIEAQAGLNKATNQWQQTPDALTRAQNETVEQQTELTHAVTPWASPLIPAMARVQSETQAIAAATQPLLDAAQSAHAKAQREWQSAYRLAYGREPDTGAGRAAALDRPDPSMAAPSVAMMSRPDIRSHAFEMFSELDGEIEGFGAYTYVLVRSASDMKLRPVQQRFVRLLATLQTLPDASLVPTDLAQHVNVFCVPVLPGNERAFSPEDVQYASDLGQQLKMRAQNGLLTQSSVRHRLSNSPGPFLITLPTRLSKALTSTPILIADLSTYPEEAIADLANQYMSGLVDDFPAQKALWRPPVLQRVALFMIHMAEGTGELITSAMPTAQASTPPR